MSGAGKIAAAVLLTVGLSLVNAPAEAATRPLTLTCPHNTTPGWLNERSIPTSCVGNSPCPETLTGDCAKPKHRARIYVVRPGDTLWRIAVKVNGGREHAGHQYRAIMALNRLRTTVIHPGQKLRVH